jgi:hypothetical protein
MSLSAFALTMAMLAGGGFLIEPKQQPVGLSGITYQEFMRLDADARRQVFVQVPPTKQAELVRTHLIEWRGRNRQRLTSDQLAFLERSIAMVKADLYAAPKSKQQQMQIKEMLNEARRLFVVEDVYDAFLLESPSQK